MSSRTILGEGGYGRVWMVIIAPNAPFAVKEFDSPEFYREEKEKFKLLREKRIEGIVRFHHCDDEKNEIWMEYCPGNNLYDLTRQYKMGPLTENKCIQLLKIFQDLFRILKNLHQHGLVHRDIKSQNIIINKNFEVTLVDVGIMEQENHIDERRYSRWWRSLSAMFLPAIHSDDVFAAMVTIIHTIVPKTYHYTGDNTREQMDMWVHMLSQYDRRQFLEMLVSRGSHPRLVSSFEDYFSKHSYYSDIKNDLFDVRRRIASDVSLMTKMKFLRMIDILDDFMKPSSAEDILQSMTKLNTPYSPTNSTNASA